MEKKHQKKQTTKNINKKQKKKTFIIHNVSKMFHNIIIHNVSKTFASKSIYIYIYSDKIMIFRVDWISQTESPRGGMPPLHGAGGIWFARRLI